VVCGVWCVVCACMYIVNNNYYHVISGRSWHLCFRNKSPYDLHLMLIKRLQQQWCDQADMCVYCLNVNK